VCGWGWWERGADVASLAHVHLEAGESVRSGGQLRLKVEGYSEFLFFFVCEEVEK